MKNETTEYKNRETSKREAKEGTAGHQKVNKTQRKKKKKKRIGDEGGRTKLGYGRGEKMTQEGKEETVDRGEKDEEKKAPKN